MLIEQTVKEYLDSKLNVSVELEMPETMPDSFVVAQVIARGKENHINEVTMEFLSYAESNYKAALLDEAVREAMESIVELPDISCHFGGGNNNFDTTNKRYRYRCYYNLYY